MSSKILIKINDTIKGKAPISSSRSSEWPKIRAKHLESNRVCIVCGGNRKLEVHHIIPFHVKPELELVSSNLVTLCEDGSDGIICHLAIGHLGSYKSYNENIVEDAKILNYKILNRPLKESKE